MSDRPSLASKLLPGLLKLSPCECPVCGDRACPNDRNFVFCRGKAHPSSEWVEVGTVTYGGVSYREFHHVKRAIALYPSQQPGEGSGKPEKQSKATLSFADAMAAIAQTYAEIESEAEQAWELGAIARNHWTPALSLECDRAIVQAETRFQLEFGGLRS
jgi:hypothetical protein